MAVHPVTIRLGCAVRVVENEGVVGLLRIVEGHVDGVRDLVHQAVELVKVIIPMVDVGRRNSVLAIDDDVKSCRRLGSVGEATGGGFAEGGARVSSGGGCWVAPALGWCAATRGRWCLRRGFGDRLVVNRRRLKGGWLEADVDAWTAY